MRGWLSMRTILALATIGAEIPRTAAAHAQVPVIPAPIPDAILVDVPYGVPITLDQAHKAIAAADVWKRNGKMGITRINPSGNLIADASLDNAYGQGIVQTPSILDCAQEPSGKRQWVREG